MKELPFETKHLLALPCFLVKINDCSFMHGGLEQVSTLLMLSVVGLHTSDVENSLQEVCPCFSPQRLEERFKPASPGVEGDELSVD
jgi:hypothetical protein